MKHQGQWESGSPCTDEEIEELKKTAPVEFPDDYLAYLRQSNGTGGDIPVQPWLVEFWKANEVASMNEGYEVAMNVPGFYAFGASGGGEMFAFDTRHGTPWPIVIIPFIPMDANEAIQIAPSFSSFRDLFGFSDEEPVDEIRLDDWGHPINPNA